MQVHQLVNQRIKQYVNIYAMMKLNKQLHVKKSEVMDFN